MRSGSSISRAACASSVRSDGVDPRAAGPRRRASGVGSSRARPRPRSPAPPRPRPPRRCRCPATSWRRSAGASRPRGGAPLGKATRRSGIATGRQQTRRERRRRRARRSPAARRSTAPGSALVARGPGPPPRRRASSRAARRASGPPGLEVRRAQDQLAEARLAEVLGAGARRSAVPSSRLGRRRSPSDAPAAISRETAAQAREAGLGVEEATRRSRGSAAGRGGRRRRRSTIASTARPKTGTASAARYGPLSCLGRDPEHGRGSATARPGDTRSTIRTSGKKTPSARPSSDRRSEDRRTRRRAGRARGAAADAGDRTSAQRHAAPEAAGPVELRAARHGGEGRRDRRRRRSRPRGRS